MENKRLKIGNHYNDYLLWLNIKKGNKLCFCLFFRKYFPLLVVYGKSLHPLEKKVENCVQDVFVDIWVYRNYLNYNVNVKMFLFLIVHKKIKNMQNRNDFYQKPTFPDFVDCLIDFYDKTNSTLEDEIEK